MKKLLFTALMLTALLAATVGTAFAGSALELVGVSHNSGGISFTFRVNGEFSQSELQSGFVQVQGGDDFPLYCSQTAADEVVCHTSKKVAGHDIVVGFGGARFWTDVPEEWAPPATCGEGYGYWYPAYDVAGPFSPPGTTEWSYFGDACTDNPATEAQRIRLYNPEWQGTFTYEYWGDGLDPVAGFAAGWTNQGEGFYWGYTH